jgi:hypothetical protein
MTIKKTIQKKMTDTERIEFVKQLEDFYQASHADLKKVMGFTFLKGVATGLGVFIGGTIAVSLILWMLSLLTVLPFVGDISQSAEQSISNTNSKAQ